MNSNLKVHGRAIYVDILNQTDFIVAHNFRKMSPQHPRRTFVRNRKQIDHVQNMTWLGE